MTALTLNKFKVGVNSYILHEQQTGSKIGGFS